MPNLPGHQRNVSQGQHLIVERGESGDEEDSEKRTACAAEEGVGGSAYPAASPPYSPSRPQANRASGICHDARIRSNIKVILGSIVLTVVGIVLLVVGSVVVLRPEEGMQHWVFFFAGLVCFIPGFYHVYYVTCTLCGRPGYSFDKLPTFNR